MCRTAAVTSVCNTFENYFGLSASPPPPLHMVRGLMLKFPETLCKSFDTVDTISEGSHPLSPQQFVSHISLCCTRHLRLGARSRHVPECHALAPIYICWSLSTGSGRVLLGPNPHRVCQVRTIKALGKLGVDLVPIGPSQIHEPSIQNIQSGALIATLVSLVGPP
jgi:hypothetical protein